MDLVLYDVAHPDTPCDYLAGKYFATFVKGTHSGITARDCAIFIGNICYDFLQCVFDGISEDVLKVDVGDLFMDYLWFNDMCHVKYYLPAFYVKLVKYFEYIGYYPDENSVNINLPKATYIASFVNNENS